MILQLHFQQKQMLQRSYRAITGPVMPTDVQALTVLQSLVSDNFQAKHAPSTQSTQRKGEDEAFQLIQKIPQPTPTSPMGSSKAPFVA